MTSYILQEDIITPHLFDLYNYVNNWVILEDIPIGLQRNWYFCMSTVMKTV